jgi:hypothetical protein
MLVALALALAAAPQTDTATTCATKLEASLAALEKITPRKRGPGVLRIAEKSCSLLPAPLRIAAVQAAPLPLKERSEVLAKAARAYLPKGCTAEPSSANATELARTCPLPGRLRPTESELADLDRGTYAFGWVVLDQLARAGIRRDSREAWYLNLSLATALERYGR